MPKFTKRADGRYVKKIVDKRTGKAVYIYGKSEKELMQNILQYEGKERKGRTFGEVADAWWEETEPTLAIQSRRNYKPNYERAIVAFGDAPIREIMPKQIASFLRKFAATGKAQKTVAGQKLVLNLIFKYAVVENDIQINPCTAVTLPSGLEKESRKAASDIDESIVKDNSDIWLFPFFAIMTGMRKGEILALQWKDIDFDRNIISVTKSVAHDGDRPFIKTPKTKAGNRVVPLLAPLKDKLLEIDKRNPNDYVFSDDGKKPLTNRRYLTLYKHYRDQTGASCTAHQLRHSFATFGFESGLDPKTMQEILGHKQISTTMDLYTDFRQKALDNAAKTLTEALSSAEKAKQES